MLLSAEEPAEAEAAAVIRQLISVPEDPEAAVAAVAAPAVPEWMMMNIRVSHSFAQKQVEAEADILTEAQADSRTEKPVDMAEAAADPIAPEKVVIYIVFRQQHIQENHRIITALVMEKEHHPMSEIILLP